MDIKLSGSGNTPTFTVPVNTGEVVKVEMQIVKKCSINVKFGDPPGFVDGLQVKAVYEGVQLKPAAKKDASGNVVQLDYFQAHGYIFHDSEVLPGVAKIEFTFQTAQDSVNRGATSSPIKMELQQIVGR